MKLVFRLMLFVIAALGLKTVYDLGSLKRPGIQRRDISKVNRLEIILDKPDVPAKHINSDMLLVELQRGKFGNVNAGKRVQQYAKSFTSFSSSSIRLLGTSQKVSRGRGVEELRDMKSKISGESSLEWQTTGRQLSKKQAGYPCEVFGRRSEESETPFKVFVYDMPGRYTHDLVECVMKSKYKYCMRLGHCGFGDKLAEDGVLSVHDTHQFSLEVIIHQKMLVSPFRTLNYSEADVFYAPFYATLMRFCINEQQKRQALINDFFVHLSQSEHFLMNRPHLAAAGRIQREMTIGSVPLFTHELSHKLVYLTIEEDQAPQLLYRMNKNVRVIPVPYPSYAHYNPSHILMRREKLLRDRYRFLEKERNVFLFWAASTRKSIKIRTESVMPQFKTSTTLGYEQFMKTRANSTEKTIRSLWLHTRECAYYHRNITLQWMQRSVFCLQPPGDSPTRKSTFDAILSGCIPIIFENAKGKVRYPFFSHLNYTDFTVTLPLKHQRKTNYVDYLMVRYKQNDIRRLQQNIFRVASFFQYSYPLHYGKQRDAMVLVMKEVQRLVESEKGRFKGGGR